MIEDYFEDGKCAARKLVLSKYQVAQTLPLVYVSSQVSWFFTLLLISKNVLEQALCSESCLEKCYKNCCQNSEFYLNKNILNHINAK